ncbi:NAD-dependent epimerase/dehydratase family protein [Gordonia insulae]|uniref:3 beta-hydroxysteroid dehydrogenase/Delta 5-->4-isomerase n=1 Tax=Gordonia insulae TaxID=2420509 RepID=A0A3G8JVR0_9ACTN|nr:NAD-dependent epimerase/dehydratase family protein [Gordonia insulae]AZG48260.1 3 beta-hydroxysteroid dehydrogenase/Delta 5-->4-isomerase [Gordonia insulae]
MKLVIGATGFLGSHVVRQLVAAGEQVRVLIRSTSETRAIDDLPLDRVVGELTDEPLVRSALAGCDVVFYCAVDTRAWLTDAAPLYRTNVEALRAVLDVAVHTDLRAFVFTSTLATIGHVDGRPATEDDAFNWRDKAPEYVRTRVAAENLVMEYVRDHGLPAVAMCVSNTYGAGDWQPTPHGGFVAGAALGKLPFTVRGCRAESVGIDDAARALILAADHGRPGHRYIVSERCIDLGEIISTAAGAAGRRPPRVVLHRPALYVCGAVGSAMAALTGRPRQLTLTSVRLMHYMSAMDHGKAERELGWQPKPVPEAVAEGARFWVDRVARRRAAGVGLGHADRP